MQFPSPLKDVLIVDIETVPQVPSYMELESTVQQLWTEKMSRYLSDDFTPEVSYEQRGGILSEFGKVICISVAYFFEATPDKLSLKVKNIYGDDEKQLLEEFIKLSTKIFKRNPNFQYAGHNIREFDIPYLCRRIIINQLHLPTYLQLHDKKPWEAKMLDTMGWWRFGDIKNYTSLSLLAHALGIPSPKSDMDGSMVQKVYYELHDLKRIAIYCQQDVVTVANVILRFNHISLLELEDIQVV